MKKMVLFIMSVCVLCRSYLFADEVDGFLLSGEKVRVVTILTGLKCPLDESSEDRQFFSRLSDEAKGIVFAQLVDVIFFPDIFDAENPRPFHDLKVDDNVLDMKEFCYAIREYREGLLVGYLFTLCQMNEEKWNSVLFLDPSLFSDNGYNFSKIRNDLAGHDLFATTSAQEFRLLDSLHLEKRQYRFQGYIKGKDVATRLILVALDQVERSAKTHSGWDLEKYKRGVPYYNAQKINEEEKKERLKEAPAREAMFFLKSMLIKKMKSDKNVIAELLKAK